MDTCNCFPVLILITCAFGEGTYVYIARAFLHDYYCTYNVLVPIQSTDERTSVAVCPGHTAHYVCTDEETVIWIVQCRTSKCPNCSSTESGYETQSRSVCVGFTASYTSNQGEISRLNITVPHHYQPMRLLITCDIHPPLNYGILEVAGKFC